ncbi:hypothetical protein L596_019789 [Steinernema carpocapsae]|uniref:Major facilitator superfamily (MFS) profile domain-containing protein n=1 Tax=Steinernema carpocapsae TaxID=34508 RepID=A0A4U5MRN7_STECR|nr:hypothetical protein L596_019789 [Steinernema carpocapsae]
MLYDGHSVAPAKRPPLFSPKSVRLRIVLLMMFALFCSAILRNNLGVTIVCMVNATAIERKAPAKSLLLADSKTEECPASTANQSLEQFGYNGELLWDPSLQGIMFSASTFGSVVTLLPSGMLADRLAPKYMIFWPLLFMAVVSYLSPFFANLHPWAFIVSRFLLGMAHGCITPALTSFAARWFVPDERSTMNALFTSGMQVSGFLLGVTTPVMCESDILGGWPLVFYFYATATVIWGMLWFFIASNHAEGNKKISDWEKKYITENVVVKKVQKQTLFPFKAAFSSSAFWAILFVRTNVVIQETIMFAYTASYIRDVLRANLQMNGLFTSLPYVMQIFSKNFVSMLADCLKRRKVMSHTTSVRVFQSISNVGNVFCFLGLAFLADCNHVMLGVTLLIAKNVFTSFISPGLHTSALSIAPLHSGSVQSVTMFCAFILGSVSPLLVGTILQHGSKAEWAIIFIFIAAVNVLSGIFFAIFGSAEVQEWAMPKKIFPAPPKLVVSPPSISRKP